MTNPLPLVIDGGKPFGALIIEAVPELKAAIAKWQRIQTAMASCQSTWVEHGNADNGEEFEVAGNLFGVTPDSANPGNQGTSALFQVNTIIGALNTMVSAAGGALTALDQGGSPA